MFEKIISGKAKEVKNIKGKDSINLIYMIKKIYPMVFKAKPSYYIYKQSISVFFGLSIGLNVMIAQMFFDSIYNASIGENTINSIIIAFIFFIVLKLTNDVLSVMNTYVSNVQDQRVLGYLNMEINKKSALIDPVEYENPKHLDDINKASIGAGSAKQFENIISNVFTFYLPYFLFMGFYLHNLKPALILCLLFVFIPVIIAQILRSSVFSKLENKVAPIRREFDAYTDAACGKGFYKETRNLGSFAYLKNLIDNTIYSLNSALWHANKRSALINCGFNTLSLLGYGGILFLLVKYLLDGEITVGAFAAVYNSIGVLFMYMERVINNQIGTIANNFGQIRNFLKFLEIPTDNRSDLSINKKSTLTIKNASFKYPNSNNNSLKEINLSIKSGEIIAIVGENGAGKTTLIKLLTGLYKPTQGSVKIGDIDVNTISYRSLFENVSGIFQRYQRYALTLKENVQIADFEKEYVDGKVEKILEDNHIDKDNKNTFPNGLDTMLSREFDGVELSGGQWQRIAIARGFYRDSDIIVLDEPTASIDPIEESAIYKKFVEIAKDKTAIIVTHRMGSAKIAERIIVMKNGEIVETGSHDDLITTGGAYAEMYAMQADWYKRKV